MDYTLRRIGPAAVLPGAILVVALGLSLAGAIPIPPEVFLVLLALGLYQGAQRTLVLRVDADGIRLGRGVMYEYGAARTLRTDVPWEHVREVGVRLNEGAPLPDGARSMVSDPGRPDALAPDLRVAVPGRFDRAKLEAAVAAHGPAVPVADLNRA
jgi:hypothetical protein